jgi:hypothetical protein
LWKQWWGGGEGNEEKEEHFWRGITFRQGVNHATLLQVLPELLLLRFGGLKQRFNEILVNDISLEADDGGLT